MKRTLLIAVAILVLVLPFSAMAQTTEDMLQGKQDMVVMGSVKDIRDDIITITVDHCLGNNNSDLIGTDIQVEEFSYTYCEKHSTSEFRSPMISDNVVVSVNRSGDIYSLANAAYKVDSNEYANCKIIVLGGAEEDCVNDLLSATCYIRANAMVNKFDFDSEGRIYAVYPQSPEQCLTTVSSQGQKLADEETPDELPAVPAPAPAQENQPTQDYTMYTIIILVVGVFAGMAVAYALFARRKNK